ncbi:hypothetical protein FOZ63_026976 [Perkinsus olseni]|uniref:Fe-S metabolism associated domain-containing protein n=1 Tax=Perkinsus olseni TaxID=32597 RepID=A0A7J6SZE8_PEROL|nr:hypothetical protein FOZ63_026976 [Perkinsus olseni]
MAGPRFPMRPRSDRSSGGVIKHDGQGRRRRARLSPSSFILLMIVTMILIIRITARFSHQQPMLSLSSSPSSSAQLYRQLIWLGRQNDDNGHYRYTDDDRVSGCVSRVYVACNWMPENESKTDSDRVQPQHRLLYTVRAEDSPLTRGLAKLLTSKLNGKTPEEVLAVDGEELVEHFGLAHSLTPQRTNGFVSMIRHMQRQADEKRRERQRHLRGRKKRLS